MSKKRGSKNSKNSRKDFLRNLTIHFNGQDIPIIDRVFRTQVSHDVIAYCQAIDFRDRTYTLQVIFYNTTYQRVESSTANVNEEEILYLLSKGGFVTGAEKIYATDVLRSLPNLSRFLAREARVNPLESARHRKPDW